MTPANKIIGRKRHIAADPGGRVLMVNLTIAAIFDRVLHGQLPKPLRY